MIQRIRFNSQTYILDLMHKKIPNNNGSDNNLELISSEGIFSYCSNEC